MPIYNWDMSPYANEELKREYYSTLHFRKMINGASGFSPPPWQKLVVGLMMTFPNSEAIDTLTKLRVSYIIVHTKEYDMLRRNSFAVRKKNITSGSDIVRELNNNKRSRLVKRIDADYIYEIIY